MTTARVYKGDTLTINLAAAANSGDPVSVGFIAGVALNKSLTSSPYTVVMARRGVFRVPVKGHNGAANTAVNIGDRVYHTAGETFVDVDSAAKPFGYALEAVTSGATTTVRVLLNQ
jgi:predicted RecA/RadA family phage recombinase